MSSYRYVSESKDFSNAFYHLQEFPIVGVSSLPIEGDKKTWNIVITGPIGSPFEGGDFIIEVCNSLLTSKALQSITKKSVAFFVWET